MIVAFMGNDGTGKTTVIKSLNKKLTDSGIKTVYVPGYNHIFLDHLKTFYQKVTGKDISKLQNEYDDAARPKTYVFFYIWPYLVFIDCFFLLIKYCSKLRKTVLFDRYVYDYLISFQNLGVFTRLARHLLLMFPKPKHCFIFDASAEVVYERKKYDHRGNVDYYRKQREGYLWLARKKNIPVINTDGVCPEEIAQKIFNQVFEKKRPCLL